MKKNNINIILVIILVIAAALARIINANLHLPNYAPLIAISVFAGAVIKDKRGLAFMVPLLGQLLADVYFSAFTNIAGFYGILGMVFNYGGLFCATAIGSRMKINPLNAILGTFGAAILFFLLSNLGYFLQGWNGYSFTALIKTYIDGIPFFKPTIEGNMVCCIVLFGTYALLQLASRKKMQKVRA